MTRLHCFLSDADTVLWWHVQCKISTYEVDTTKRSQRLLNQWGHALVEMRDCASAECSSRACKVLNFKNKDKNQRKEVQHHRHRQQKAKRHNPAPSTHTEHTMTDHDSHGVAQEIVEDAAQLFGIEELGSHLACILFQSFKQLSRNDVKFWLPQKLTMNKILWKHGRITQHREACKEKSVHLISMLMFCWSKTAHTQERITVEQLNRIVTQLLASDVESQPPDSASIPDSSPPPLQSPASLTLPVPNPPPRIRHSVVSFYANYKGTTTLVEEKKDVLDAVMPETGHTSIDVLSPEAVFHAKN
jgi:hypothetical protein